MSDIRQTLTRTKAGRRFMGFMRTINQGDNEAIAQLVTDAIDETALEAHNPEIWAAQLQYIHAMSEGLRAVNVIAEDEYRVVVLMQAHKNNRMHIVDMAVSEDYPHKVLQFIQRLADE
jgi:hypothetical protein